MTDSGLWFSVFVSSQILGPAMYGLVYMKTVATFPRTILLASVMMILISFTLLAPVRLPREPCTSGFGGGDVEEDVDVRGRGDRLGREDSGTCVGIDVPHGEEFQGKASCSVVEHRDL